MGARMGNTGNFKKSIFDGVDDDSDLVRTKIFENGHWIWDEGNECLTYVSDVPPEVVEAIGTKFTLKQNITFNDDVDLIEQRAVKENFVGKPAHLRSLIIFDDNPQWASVVDYLLILRRGPYLAVGHFVAVPDVKDIALFTAPFNILSPTLINMLHTPTTERFLRALILYGQYYLQVKNEMAQRMMEDKVRTYNTEDIEFEFQDNLTDLRVLVAKEYSMFIIGGSDLKKFHHMGSNKKRQSLSYRDARQFLTFMRMCVQIVWLALGRRNFTELEVEINRLVKGDTFNDVEHTRKEDLAQLSSIEKEVLYGDCIIKDRMLNLRSPLSYDLFCVRDVDYRMLNFGVVQNKKMSTRLKYMLIAVAGPEEDYEKFGITVGILGKPRSGFDTLLNYIIRPKEGSTTSGKSRQSVQSKLGKSGSSKSSAAALGLKKLYGDVVLPSKYDDDMNDKLPDIFPQEKPVPARCNEIQWRRWQIRLHRLLNPRGVVLPRRQEASQQKVSLYGSGSGALHKITKDASILYVRGRR